MTNILFILYLLFCAAYNVANCNKQNQYSNSISTIINDYTLVNTESLTENIVTNFSLHFYLEQNSRKTDAKYDWVSIKNTFTKFNQISFEDYIYNEVVLLNRAIINTTNGLLNMCDKMIEKTTSVLPLSYSYKLATDTFKEEGLAYNSNSIISGITGLFASKELKESKDLDQIMEDMYEFQLHRLAISNRASFLNSLCDNTFGSPYTLNYNPVHNSLSFTYDPNAVKYYIVIIQNIIDNSLIKGLNKGFKVKGNNGFNSELDTDKLKTASLVEKAKYILPIVQKLSRKLPTYLDNIAKKSLTIQEYFDNLLHFWLTIFDQANIGSHELPITFMKEQLEAEKRQLEAEKKQLAQYQEQLDNEKRQLAQDLAAEIAAQQIIKEYRQNALIEDAKNYVRHQDILLEDRNQNYTIIKWDQINRRFKKHINGLTNIFDSMLDGLGSFVRVPTKFIIGIASDTVKEIGKVVIIGLVLFGSVLFVYNKIVKWFV
jgi:hypothetical protein